MTTYYLKYRPQRISELDLDGVRDQLQKIVSSGRMPHAFLFAGPRGSGKTSTARIVAKVLNCEHPQPTTHNPQHSPEPCNECSQCIAITRGSSLDVVEIDAASNRGVDDIRSLRETVKLAPIGAEKKVYIIDEAHMLTTEAANALLKTLEEPPEHAVFILATTAPEKLLDTIRSRCTIINFYKGKEVEITRALKKAVEGEELEIDTDALAAISKGVDGSFREAHKILEQLSFKKGKITARDVVALSATNFTDPVDLLKLLAKGEAKLALSEIDNLVNQGVNLKSYLTGMVGTLRKMLLARMGVEQESEDIEEIKEIEDIKNLIELFSEAARQYPTALVPQLPLEIAVVKWCVGFEDSQLSRLPLNSTPARGGTGSRDFRAVLRVDSNPLEPVSNNRGQRSTTDSPSLKEEKAEKIVSKVSAEELDNLWPQIMRLIKERNHSAEALLRAARPTAFDGKTLQIEVFYKFHKERLEKEPYRDVVEEVAATLLGGPLKLACVLTEEKKRAADVRNVATPEDEDLAKLAEDIFNAPGDGKVH